GCLLDHVIEGLKRGSIALILHRQDALLHEPVDAGIVRLQLDPPDMLLDQAGLRRTGGGPKTFAQTVEARIVLVGERWLPRTTDQQRCQNCRADHRRSRPSKHASLPTRAP